MKLIDKEKVVAEIERRIKIHHDYSHYNAEQEFTKVLSFLDALETKEDVNGIIKTAEDHAYFAGSENTREKLVDKACEWLRKGGSGWYLTSEYGNDEINFVKLAKDFRKSMEE